MKTLLKTVALLGCVALLMAACKKEKPSCQRVDYMMNGVEVTTYQWMTETEAQATFSKYQNVKITHFNEAEVDCFTHNFDK